MNIVILYNYIDLLGQCRSLLIPLVAAGTWGMARSPAVWANLGSSFQRQAGRPGVVGRSKMGTKGKVKAA